MARYVLSLPGKSGAHDSTDYSGWVQPADVPGVPMNPDTTFEEGRQPLDPQSAIASEQVADPPHPEEPYPTDLWGLATGLMAGFDGVPAVGQGASFYHEDWRPVSGLLDGDDDPIYYSHDYSGQRGGTALTPSVNGRYLNWTPAWLPAPPAGAIGYEVETDTVKWAYPNPDWNYDTHHDMSPGDPGYQPEYFYTTADVPLADPVSCEFTVSLQTATGTGSNGGSIGGLNVVVAVNNAYGGGQPVFHNEAGAFWFDLEGEGPNVLKSRGMGADGIPDSQSYGMAIHRVITSGMEAVPREYTFEINDFLTTGTAPRHTGAFGLYYGMTKDVPGMDSGAVKCTPLVGENHTVQAGEGFVFVGGTYVIRPPRIRWIFGDVVPVPPVLPPAYRRVYPRDDALAGGASRTWPPSKATQSSNRTFGGYL